MINATKQALLISLMAISMVACSGMATKNAAQTASAPSVATSEEADSFYQNENNLPAETVVITARGWGAPPKQYYPEGNRRLMTMRAAKLDAYRSLAERIHGLRIWGGTTIGDMVLEQDQFKVLLDAYVVGARVLSIMPQKDGNYEAIVEIELDRNFLHRALANRKERMTVPSGYGALPKTAHKEPAATVQNHEAANVEKSALGSQNNFYFSD